MTFMNELKARVERSNTLWDQIDGLIKVLQSCSLSENEAMLLKIILLMSEQIRPIGSEKDLEEVSKDVSSMISDMMNQIKKGK